MFTLPPLPYAETALEPHMSAETLKLHHGKHHKAYVDKLNALVEGTPLADLELEALIERVAESDDPKHEKIFNNAAQHWNHSFFWQSLSPESSREPVGEMADLIARDLGGIEAFVEDFKQQGVDHFGSGWVWLVLDKGKLAVVTTHDAGLPLTQGQIPLLTCDLWEHAYYVDYRNERPKFLDAFLNVLIDWDFAADNLAAAMEPAG